MSRLQPGWLLASIILHIVVFRYLYRSEVCCDAVLQGASGAASL
jgi:hypothetical protein